MQGGKRGRQFVEVKGKESAMEKKGQVINFSILGDRKMIHAGKEAKSKFNTEQT